MLLLDTCTLLMLGGRQGDLSIGAVQQLQANPGELYVSTITAFEIVLKSVLGKLELPLPAEDWYREAIRLHGVQEVPVSSAIAMRSAALPFVHKDPCDRIIIATALECKMRIITVDKTIPRYRGVRVVW